MKQLAFAFLLAFLSVGMGANLVMQKGERRIIVAIISALCILSAIVLYN